MLINNISSQPVTSAVSPMGNLRDIGGHITRHGGRIRTGLIYRCNELSAIGSSEMENLIALQLKHIYDLRSCDERRAKPDSLPPDVNYVILDVLAGSDSMLPANLFEELLRDPEAAAEYFTDGKAVEMFRKNYSHVVHLPSAKASYRRLFNDMTNPAMLPGLFHCASGKDRTGWVSAMLLTLLDVPEDTVMEEYLISNNYSIPRHQSLLDGLQAMDIDIEIVMPLICVKPEYLIDAFLEMYCTYGSIESYFSNALGINRTAQQILRRNLIEW